MLQVVKMMESGEIDQDLPPSVKDPLATANGHATPPDNVTAPESTDSDSNSHSFVTLSPPTSPGEWTGWATLSRDRLELCDECVVWIVQFGVCRVHWLQLLQAIYITSYVINS